MIDVTLLGSLRVTGAHGRRADIRTQRGEELLVFLFLEQGRQFPRAQLAENFWPHLPEDRARRALNTELWRVCRALEGVGMDVSRAIRRTSRDIGYVRQPDHHFDLDTLADAMTVVDTTTPDAASEADLDCLKRAIAAYKGDLLESVYSDWCLLWRESLRAKHTTALEFMLHAAMGRNDWAAALGYGRDLLALDPLMENVHRALMRCHYHNGNRPLALRQYALCEQLLREELGVEPMDETRRVQETILAVNPQVSRAHAEKLAASSVPRPIGRHSPAQKVDLALANINTARNWLEGVSQDLRRPDPETV